MIVSRLRVVALVGLAVLGPGPASTRADEAARRPGDRTEEGEIREAAVAGRFYPADPAKLRAALDGFLADARPAAGGRPIALVVPHAGYLFSGQIAADAFAQAARFQYDVVVILGTNHTVSGFDGVSIWGAGGFRTPLGVAAVDTDLARRLASVDRAFERDATAHRSEHSVEVQVPFVQRLFPDATILPVVVGSADPDLCTRFGNALAAALVGRRALVVASSDLSHYPRYDDAVAADRKTLEAVAGFDPVRFRQAVREPLRRDVPNLGTCACGEAPILAAMVAARELGATHAAIVSYANSGDTAVGDRDRVVGYGAVVFTAGRVLGGEADVRGGDAMHTPPPADAADRPITAEDRQALLAFARESIRRYLDSETTPLARGFGPALYCKRGAFVTLEKHGELRGCIGHMAEDTPLCQVVGSMALQAALNDRRFAPVRQGELEELDIEISVLTPTRPVPGPEAIVIGRDGVVLESSGASAVFLPQVAVEQGWDVDTTLEHLCRKAGLAGDCWRRDARLRTFQAEVFAEPERR